MTDKHQDYIDACLRQADYCDQLAAKREAEGKHSIAKRMREAAALHRAEAQRFTGLTSH